MQRFEYKFVRLDRSRWFGTAPSEAKYHQQILEFAKDGWRFVQLFAPGTALYGHAAYFELIFERPMAEENPEKMAAKP